MGCVEDDMESLHVKGGLMGGEEPPGRLHDLCGYSNVNAIPRSS